jgi:hypothetical protein
LLVPAVTETKWGKENFDAFYDWLYVDDGFGKILDWCHTFNDYVTVGEEAPSTEARNAMIATSRSQIYTEASELAETFAAVKNPQVITYRLITTQLAETIQREKHFERINAKLILAPFRAAGLYITHHEDRFEDCARRERLFHSFDRRFRGIAPHFPRELKGRPFHTSAPGAPWEKSCAPRNPKTSLPIFTAGREPGCGGIPNLPKPEA